MQIRHNPLSGGYCGEVPPLPIPNREVKLTCADGTAMQCGRVGSRLLLSRASDFERFLRLFCFHADWFFLTQMFFGARRFFFDAFSFSHRFHRFTQIFDLLGLGFRRWTQLLLPFYFFTFLPFYLYQVYKMLLNCRFYIKKIGKITY